jgi:hypothetical protein
MVMAKQLVCYLDLLKTLACVQLEEISPTRLAVQKFFGFVTDGEVARQ